MKMNMIAGAASIALGVGLSGCADYGQPGYGSAQSSSQDYPSQSQSYPSQSQSYQLGYVDRIEVVNKDAGSNIAGTIIGGIVGGLIGSQIGSGTGQTAATIAGAAGGAIVGNQIEGRRRADNETFRVSVRLDNGSYQTITQDNISDLRTGDRVRVEGNQVYRT